MGIYIKGMEMPENCWKCNFAEGEICLVDMNDHGDYDHPDNCPLIEIQPHGRLLKVLKTERECVSRDCNRDCGKCDLSLEQDEILSAYDTLIVLFAGPAEEGET